MAEAGVVVEVRKEDLVCINPLTVAIKNDKKRLCIDLSRCYNEVSVAPKFKIESTMEALEAINPEDWMFAFDSKSAYHQVPVNKNCWKYLGFTVENNYGKKRHFSYTMLPFGLNDACRVLTKIMKSQIQRWRNLGLNIFIHIDDGLGFCARKEDCLKASRMVREDLRKYGLLISEDKCVWGATQTLTWTGFQFDTVQFKLSVSQETLKKAETVIKQVLQQKTVETKLLARVAGLLISFHLAMGEVTRFNTRAIMMNIAEVTERYGWKGKLTIDTRVEEELSFWEKNLFSLNGNRIRKEDKVVTMKTKDIYSDAGEFLVGGAEFIGEKVKEETMFKQHLGEDDIVRSSTYRELRGVEEGLEARGESLRGHLVRWGCDNWAATKIIIMGSMKKDCHSVAKRISQICQKLEIKLEPFWLRRNSIQITFCDSFSKDFDSSD